MAIYAIAVSQSKRMDFESQVYCSGSVRRGINPLCWMNIDPPEGARRVVVRGVGLWRVLQVRKRKAAIASYNCRLFGKRLPWSAGGVKGGVAFMIDALIWYTGLAAWVLIVLAFVSMLAAEINDRSVARRRYK